MRHQALPGSSLLRALRSESERNGDVLRDPLTVREKMGERKTGEEDLLWGNAHGLRNEGENVLICGR
jgi:hypothetical protein